jgi:choline dehydrogenase-like flavoprotein
MNGRKVYHGARQGARCGRVQHQRHDLPARQPPRLRALGRRPRHGARGTTPTACPTSSAWRIAWPPTPPTTSAARLVRWGWSAARRQNPLFQAFFAAVQEAGYPLTTGCQRLRQEGFAAFDRNIRRRTAAEASRAYLHPVMNRPNLTVDHAGAGDAGDLRGATAPPASSGAGQGRGGAHPRQARSILCGGSIQLAAVAPA